MFDVDDGMENVTINASIFRWLFLKIYLDGDISGQHEFPLQPSTPTPPKKRGTRERVRDIALLYR